MSVRQVSALLAGLSIALFAQAQSGQMYRYVNADGVKVVGYQVPPEFVANGYEVLNSSGALVAVVPRQLDENERQNVDAQSVRERESAKEKERLRKWDESLLLRYSTIEDIENARERALRELRIRMSILRSKQRSLKRQVETYQAQAADQERLGKAVSEEHLGAIDDLQSEIAATERAIVDREAEMASQNESYDADVERFTKLLDIVELRKTMSAGGAALARDPAADPLS